MSAKSRLHTLLAAGLAAASLLTTTVALADAKDNILNIGLAAEPFTLDPGKGVAGTDYPFLYTLYARLLTFDPQTLAPRPGLAEAFEFAPDKKSLSLRLRPNLTFHDNTVLDAEAVKASLMHFKQNGRSQDLDVVSAIEVVDARNLVIRLARPYTPITAILADRAGMIISPTAQKAAGDQFDLKPVGAGPFMLKAWTPGSRMEMTRFPGYWDNAKVKLSGIVFRIIANPPSLVSAMLTGQVDYAFGLDPKNLPALKARPGMRVAVEPSVGFTMIGMNMESPLVRRAFSMSIDRMPLRDAVIGKGMGDGPTVLPARATSLTEASPQYAQALRYDPAKAKQLLTDAGQPNGITLKICASNSLAGGTDVTDIEREQLKAAGITLSVTVMTSNACLQAYNLRKEFPLWQGRFTGRPHPFMTYQQFMGPTGQYNTLKTVYPGVEALLEQIAAIEDPEKQKPLFAQLEKIWIEQMPMAPLFFLPNFSAYSDKIAGEIPNAQGKPDPTSIYFTGK